MLRLRLPLPRFVSAGEVFVGKGSLAALRGLDATRAAVIVSPSLLRQPELAQRADTAVNAHEARLFVCPTGEPSLAALQPLIRDVVTFAPDWIVAIGGGSVLDAGKLTFA